MQSGSLLGNKKEFDDVQVLGNFGRCKHNFGYSLRYRCAEGQNLASRLLLLVAPALWLLTSGICYVVCRLRRVKATATQCFIIAGLPLALGAIPMPLPYFLLVVLWYAVTVYVTMKYLGVSLFPDGVLIPLVTQGSGMMLLFVLHQLGFKS